VISLKIEPPATASSSMSVRMEVLFIVPLPCFRDGSPLIWSEHARAPGLTLITCKRRHRLHASWALRNSLTAGCYDLHNRGLPPNAPARVAA
jgi:hypothetical protein